MIGTLTYDYAARGKRWHQVGIASSKRRDSMKIGVILIATLLLAACTASGQQAKPTIIAEGGGLDDYASARVLYWNQKTDSAAGQFAINYGRPGWKQIYEDPAKFDALTKGKVWRMGSNFWTNLETQVPLNIGGKNIPVGYYYLGMHRSADGSQWSLAFIDPVEVRHARLDAFEIQKAKVKFEAPMSFAKAEGKAEKLTITFSYPKDNVKDVRLRVAWGNMAFTAPVKVSLTE
jgi:DUF2911 family protein